MDRSERLLSRCRRSLGRPRVVVALALAFCASQAAIVRLLRPLEGSAVFALQTTLSAEEFAGTLRAWRDAGLLEAYWRHYAVDFVHPLIYGAFLAALLSWALDANRKDERSNRLLWLPIAAGLLDLFENAVHVALLAEPTRISTLPVVASGIAAILKWGFVAASLAIAVVLSWRAFRLRLAAHDRSV
ncbi:hypothetical protein MYXO_00674 [Myxococcaceae bacterium]|nr:hypothetical protein MYXO_00674 [Myxococcaceae bacterium]